MTTDPMCPTTTLTPAELERVRQLVNDDPSSLRAAVEAALAHCEGDLDLMLGVIREVRTCVPRSG